MEILQKVARDSFFLIEAIDAGEGFQKKLKAMGIHCGDIVRVVQNTHGPLIIAKGNLRFALGRGMSNKIQGRVVQRDGV